MKSIDTLRPALRSKIDVDGPGGCWLWTGAIGAGGYGLLTFEGKPLRAHREVYELLVGPIPAGLELDHVWAWGCRHKHCVSPAHLEPVTHRENTRRHFAIPTHCQNGHEWTKENTYIYPSHGRRECRACMHQRYLARKAAA